MVGFNIILYEVEAYIRFSEIPNALEINPIVDLR